MLSPKERVAKVFNGEIPDRVPFVPTIYEHAASLINKTPSEVACSQELLIKSQLKAFELYNHDLVVVGLDVYNVEPEALGCEISYNDCSESIPDIKTHILADNRKCISELKLPDPQNDGRMPLFVNAAKEVKKQIGDRVFVSSSIIGPFTLACLLRGAENFLFDIMERRDFAENLLNFTAQVGLIYGSEFIKNGIGVAINDSWISPPILSPKIYRELVFPYHKKLISGLKSKGLKNPSLISGGDTTSIAKKLCETGTSLLLADANADLERYKIITQSKKIVLRGTVNPKIIEKGNIKKIKESTKEVIEIGSPGGYFVIGCGVVSYNTPAENILNFKEAVNSYASY